MSAESSILVFKLWCTSDLVLVNMALCWKERSVIGDTISSRGGHTLTPVRTLRNLCRHLIHFGGADAFGVASCDVHVIATTPNSGDTPWTSSKALHNDNTPVIPARMGHSAIAIPDDEVQLSAACRFLDRVVVFGGSVSLPEPLLYNDIWQLRVKRSFVRRGGAPASEEILVVEWTNLTDQVSSSSRSQLRAQRRHDGRSRRCRGRRSSFGCVCFKLAVALLDTHRNSSIACTRNGRDDFAELKLVVAGSIRHHWGSRRAQYPSLRNDHAPA